ncbi:MAG: alanine racemase [Christensenellaceae bacterium]|jgi:alanine racemase|nr:alanine racemase [Christensenellaceae bacterium]
MEERTYVNINLSAIKHNIQAASAKVPSGNVMAVVKADGYGHGAIPISKYIENLVAYFGVAIPQEGASLREAGITKPILILGITAPEGISQLIDYDLTATISSIEEAKQISKLATSRDKIVKIHIAIDTGMSRIGFLPCDIDKVISLYDIPGLKVTGIFTHYASADETNKDLSKMQHEKFDLVIKELNKRGLDTGIKHISNSAGIIEFDNCHFDMVRAGIMIYGLYPSKEVTRAFVLKPALTWVARISYVKVMGMGCSVSYGATYVTTGETRIATIPIGYADGYPRALSSNSRVLIKGKEAPVLGRICMDQFMVDVTNIDGVCAGDAAVIVGESGSEKITVEELADKAYSFNYEFVCGIGPRVPRVYSEN